MATVILDTSDTYAGPRYVYTTLEALAADDWSIAELEDEIRATLARGESYAGGGGAAPVFRVYPVQLETLDSACRSIQDAIGQDDGGLAGMVFASGPDDSDWARMPDAQKDILLRAYLRAEIAHLD